MTDTHLIQRQVVELQVSNATKARQLHNKISHMQSQWLAEALCRALDNLAVAETVRLDKLTLDLGALNADNLEWELRQAIQRELPRALDPILTEYAGKQSLNKGKFVEDSTQGSAQQLLEHVLNYGQLPWWADPANRNHLSRASQSLFKAARADNANHRTLLPKLRQWLAKPAAAQRLATQLSSKDLLHYLNILLPGKGREVWRVLSGLVRNSRSPQRQYLLQKLWAAVLQTAAIGNPPKHEFWQIAISKLAQRNRIGMSEQLAQFLPQGEAVAEIEGLKSEFLSQVNRSDSLLNSSAPAAWAATTTLLEYLAGFLVGKPPEIRQALSPYLRAMHSAFKKSQDVMPHLIKLIAAAKSLNFPLTGLAPAISQWAQHDARFPQGVLEKLASELEPTIAPPNSTDRTETLAIVNAGVTLFWPFLKRFFGRVGLLEGDQFSHPAAQAQAVGLLHYLATGSFDALEYQQPLNKLLCGLELSAPWQREARPAETAFAECDALLEVFLSRATNLGKLSPSGLRQSFLQRKALLQIENGAWVLRVETESYDILLDRLPWPRHWIRLPWMLAPLQVEW